VTYCARLWVVTSCRLCDLLIVASSLMSWFHWMKISNIQSYTVRLAWIDHPQIGRRLFSATTCAIFVPKVVWSPPVSQPLHASFRMKIAPVVAENKHRPIFACQIWRNFWKWNYLHLQFTCYAYWTP
jgi:hypothetical protein